MQQISPERCCGRTFRGEELAEIKEIADTCHGISRTELANTICELFSWKRPSGRLKTIECRQFLEYLASKRIIDLPDRQGGRPKGSKSKVIRTDKGECPENISGTVKDYRPLVLCRIKSKAQRDLWYEYVDRYHYLGYQLPFGAQLRYFIESRREGKILGCLQFSSPAWRMGPRDRWIGWNEEQRERNLQKLISNSRFLIFPWVKVKNLASFVLSLSLRVVPDDWERCYGYRPILVETLVDKVRFTGTCYKAANWVYVGSTTGRGRMDHDRGKRVLCPKDIYLYPLDSRFREDLLGM